MELNLLLRLLVAHLLTDFVLQPTAWVNQKKLKKHRSSKLYLHILVAGATAYVFAGLWHNWWLPVGVMISHFVIDLWKLNRSSNLTYFLQEQLFHILVVIALWTIISFSLL